MIDGQIDGIDSICIIYVSIIYGNTRENPTE